MVSKIKQIASISWLCWSGSFVVAVAPSSAEMVCKIADPTGTPLNIRSHPGGKVISKVSNGKKVRILEVVRDDRGKQWAYIGSGWVVREFIACYQR